MLWASRLRNRKTSSSTQRVWSPALLVTIHPWDTAAVADCCGHACTMHTIAAAGTYSSMLKAAGTLSRRHFGNQSERQRHHRGRPDAAAVPRCYSHVSKTMVLSVHLCPNRWSACPVSRRHLPRVRATEPEAMMRKTCYRSLVSLHQRSMQQQHSARPTYPWHQRTKSMTPASSIRVQPCKHG